MRKGCSPWDTDCVFTGKLLLEEKQYLYCDLQISIAFVKFRKKRDRERMIKQDRRAALALIVPHRKVLKNNQKGECMAATQIRQNK